MALTFADLVRRVRRETQDSEPGAYRRSDQSMADAITDGLLLVQQMRPDATVGKEDLLTVSSAQLGSTEFPLDSRFFSPVMWAAIGYLEAADDELVDEGKAATAFGMAQRLLAGAERG